MARAIASRIVMKESSKWRSGRDSERTVAFLPSGRGGKTPHTFGDDERVAADRDGYMMMPAGEASAFEVVEPELALHVLVHSFRFPSLLNLPGCAGVTT